MLHLYKLEIKMKYHIINKIIIGIGIIIICNILGHILPPFSLLLSSIYMGIVIAFVNKPLYLLNFKLTTVYNFILLLLNDLTIRIYAGGTHDSQGKAWCFLMYFIGLIIAIIIMLVYSSETEKEYKINNIITIIIGLITSILIYLNFNSPI